MCGLVFVDPFALVVEMNAPLAPRKPLLATLLRRSPSQLLSMVTPARMGLRDGPVKLAEPANSFVLVRPVRVGCELLVLLCLWLADVSAVAICPRAQCRAKVAETLTAAMLQLAAAPPMLSCWALDWREPAYSDVQRGGGCPLAGMDTHCASTLRDGRVKLADAG